MAAEDVLLPVGHFQWIAQAAGFGAVKKLPTMPVRRPDRADDGRSPRDFAVNITVISYIRQPSCRCWLPG